MNALKKMGAKDIHALLGWVKCEEKTPPLDKRVPVYGDYTCNPPFAIALWRYLPNGEAGWSSQEWRGQVAITHWYDESR